MKLEMPASLRVQSEKVDALSQEVSRKEVPSTDENNIPPPSYEAEGKVSSENTDSH